MARSRSTSPIVRWVVNATGLLLIGYLTAVALWPSIVDALPKSLRWFGRRETCMIPGPGIRERFLV